jgi:peptidylprolyl isomerase
MSVPARRGHRPARVARRGRRAAALALAVAAAVLVGCADDTRPTPEPAVEDAARPETGATVDAPDATEILTLARADRTDPPAALEVLDLTVGEGAEATAGTRVVVQYLGVRWSDGGVFDASWSRGEPFAFDLGAGLVIAGWEQGVAGMRVGGRRVLVIPPQLAYGDRGAGSVIGPGETLVFAVDLVEVG